MKIFWIIFILAFTQCLNAQTCESALKNPSMLIGERNQLDIVVRDYSSKVILPKKLEIRGFRTDEKKHKNDTISLEISSIESDSIVKSGIQNIRISFTAWDTGYVTILPIELDSVNNLVVPPTLLHVSFPQFDAKGDILDIKAGKIDLDAIEKAAAKEKTWWYIILGACIAVVLIVVLYFIFRKKKKEEVPLVVLSLYEQTKLDLDELFAHKWWEKDQTKRHFIELTDIIRNYVGKNYRIDALEKTTNELKYALKSQNVSRQHIELLIQILVESDLVKFAKQTLVPEEIVSINNRAYLFLEVTHETGEIAPEE